jgi:glycosyltransferase involved in cell wall biosynthesis
MSGTTTPSRRIRVLQVIGGMNIGGAEQVIVEIIRGLDRSRFDVGLCCTRVLGVLAEQLKDEGVEVLFAAPSSRWLRHLTPALLHRQIRRFRTDIVHSHTTAALIHTGPLGAIGLLPHWVHTFHFGNYDGNVSAQRRHERRLCQRASQLVAVSDSQRSALIEHQGVAADHIATITNGVRPATPVPAADVESARAEFGFRPEHIVIGCVAVLTEQKGITHLLDAARQIVDLLPQARFLVIGGGPLEEPLRNKAAALGLADLVVFPGWKKDAARLLPVFDVFVMSSLWEAMPMALLEAMAAKRQIVVTDVGDNRAIVDDGRCGVVVPPRDASAITQAILRILNHPAESLAMAERAVQRFDERFTTRHMVAAHEQLYERMVASRGHVPVSASAAVAPLDARSRGVRAE